MESKPKEGVVVNLFLVLLVPVLLLGLKIIPSLAQWLLHKYLGVSRKEMEHLAEAVKIEQEMKKISMVDEFAKYAKLQRRLNSITRDLEGATQERKISQMKAQTYVTVAVYLLSTILYLVLLFSSGITTPVFVMPKQWYAPLGVLLSYPTGLEGAVSIPVWTVMMRNVISTIVK